MHVLIFSMQRVWQIVFELTNLKRDMHGTEVILQKGVKIYSKHRRKGKSALNDRPPSLQPIILTSDDSTVVPTHKKCADQRQSTPRGKPRATVHEDQRRVSGSKQ
jgi:hypothetical protein